MSVDWFKATVDGKLSTDRQNLSNIKNNMDWHEYAVIRTKKDFFSYNFCVHLKVNFEYFVSKKFNKWVDFQDYSIQRLQEFTLPTH